MKRFPLLYRLLFGLIIVLFIVSFLANRKKEGSFLVKHVIDGDTIKLANERIVRYIGIDAPEMKRFTLTQGWIDDPQPFAQSAYEFNRSLVEDKSVRLEFDVQKKDKYGRWLVYCFVGDNLVNAKLLEEGYAMLYTKSPNVKYAELLVKSFRKAKDAQVGLWSKEHIIPAYNAKDFIGSIATVRGRITDVEAEREVIKLNFGSKGERVFNAVIFKEDLPYFINEGISPFKDYSGKEVKIFGLIKEYNNRPEIIIRDSSQIKIIQ